MKKQLIQIIRYLKDKDTPTTSASLANALNVSPRSVKSYINEINDLYPASITSSRKGYTLETDIAEKMLEESKSVIPQTSEERVIYIINRLIKAGVMDAYDLCDEMFISYSTLKSDLVKVRKILTEADLELVNQNDTLVISGLEKNKRKLLSNLIYSETQNKFLNNEKLSESFEGIDVRFIKDTILQKFEEYHYFINDYSLENLILHSTITIDRIRNGFTSSEDLNNIVVLKSHEYDLANSIIKELEDHFDISFNENEVIEFAMLILSRASNLNYETITMENVRQYVGEDIYELADRLIKDFSAFFYIDLSQPEFFVRFALHIKNLLVRADSDYFSKNPLTDSIKQNCPLIYDCAVNAARTIKEKTGINLNDDEIAY
ncbi:MAG: transcription antiterminator, partial [Erysipelotrichaceae bacterium]|nr:transcription antiterminator [Erysipelotrichaceae bacterium]